MTLGEIIKNYRNEHGLSMEQFAITSGISKAYVSILEKNEHPKTGEPVAPSIQTIEKAAKGMNVNFNELFNILDGSVSLAKDYVTFKNIKPITTASLPVVGSIACGVPIYMNEEREYYIDVGTNLNADFILIASGDSMSGARIHDGDLVFIRQQPTVENGEIAAVAIGDTATLKRFYHYQDKGTIVLKSENPAYEPQIYSGPELETIKILGKAIAFQSDVK